MKPFHHYARRRAAGSHASGVQYTPAQVAAAYSFPSGVTGQGIHVGIAELGGAFSQADFVAFCTANGLAPSQVAVVPVNGATITADPSGADVEVMLDVEVVAGMAPDAQITLFFGDNSIAGFAACFTAMAQAGCHVGSCSWGGPEDSYSASDITIMEAALSACVAAGCTVYCASGDSGSSDGESGKHVDYPGSSPSAISVGGTTLKAAGGVYVSETAWSGSGGGVSSLFAKPVWQTSTLGAKRLCPDAASNADPNTGFIIYSAGQQVVGGTSAAAPTWAALHALLLEAGVSTDFLASRLYALGELVFHDVVSGSNGAFKAGPGFDLVTGLGSPIGTKILAGLAATAPPPPPPAPAPVPGTPAFIATLDSNQVVVQEWPLSTWEANAAAALKGTVGL